jgi:hypothetical protein
VIKAKRGVNITLACGRRLYVDLLVIETELAQLDTFDLAESDLPLLLRRRNMDVCEQRWFGNGPVHYILPEPFPGDGMPEDSALVSALLWSDPVVEGFAFSELMVVFFAEWNEDVNVAASMQEKLQDLAWEDLAVDRCPQPKTRDQAGSVFSQGSPG